MSQKQKDILIAVITLIFVIVMDVIVFTSMKSNHNINYEKYSFITISQSYDDNNTFQKIICDPDTNVLYMMINGTIVTPLYNADGTLRTYQPE